MEPSILSNYATGEKPKRQLFPAAMMKGFILCLALALTIPAQAASEKLQRAIEKGTVTRDFIKTLTREDVPDKWKTTTETKEVGNAVTRLFKRGGEPRLRVTWLKDPTGEKGSTVLAGVYRGDTRLANISRYHDTTQITPVEEPTGYNVSTSIKDDGT